MTNEGPADRAIRVVIGFCPLYKIIGLNTCPVPKRK